MLFNLDFLMLDTSTLQMRAAANLGFVNRTACSTHILLGLWDMSHQLCSEYANIGRNVRFSYWEEESNASRLGPQPTPLTTTTLMNTYH